MNSIYRKLAWKKVIFGRITIARYTNSVLPAEYEIHLKGTHFTPGWGIMLAWDRRARRLDYDTWRGAF